MKYADDRKARFVALIGESEREKGVVLLKQMESGEQVELSEGDFLTLSWV
jgi:histidyl-tRNA synthetase